MTMPTVTGRPLTWKSLAALVLVPLLVASGFLWGTWNADDRLHQVQAAIVNLDEMVEVNGETIPAGRLLAAELVNSDREQNFTWVLADEKSARPGLTSGRFAAVVTIPEEFSAKVTSFGGEPADAEQAMIRVETSPVTGISETALGQAVAHAAANSLNRFFAEEYLKQIYLGFNDMGEQFVDLRDGTRQLADGSEQLADGTREAADGASDLADGMDQLAAGGAELAGGARQSADGAGQLADGAGQLASGVDAYAGGVVTFADGIATYADGMGTYAVGSNDFAAGLRTYADGVAQYTAGVAQFVQPIRDLLGRLTPVVDALPEFSGWVEALEEFAATLPDRLVDWNERVQAFVADLKDFLAALEGADGRGDELAADAARAGAWLQAVSSGSTTVDCPAALAEVEGGCEAFSQGVRTGASEALERVQPVVGDADGLADALGVIARNAGQIEAAADRLSAWSADAAAYAPQLEEDLRTLQGQLPEGTPRSKAELQQLLGGITAGLDQLLGAGGQLAAGGQELAAGADQLADGADGLAVGADQLADGANQLADGGRQLASGAGELAGGAGQLADGLDQLADGTGQYADGVSQAAAGTGQLAVGLGDLADGTNQLADGIEELADGVAEGADEIPSYNADERENLAQMVAQPVSTDNLERLVTPTIAWASLLLALALWIGAVATFSTVRAIDPRNALSSGTSLQLLGRALKPGLIVAGLQAVGLTAVAQLVMGLPVTTALGVGGVLLLAGAAFVAVAHALVAWLGTGGRLLAVFFGVATAVSAFAYSSPGLFRTLAALSPVTPALNGLRAVLTGHVPTTQLITLVGWLLVALALSGVAIVRSRTIKLDALVA